MDAIRDASKVDLGTNDLVEYVDIVPSKKFVVKRYTPTV